MHPLTTTDIAYGALFAALIAGGAFVVVPLGPVPVTLQVFVVLLAGMVLGPRLGLASVVVYLVLGLVAPVYAGGGVGIGALLGPTGGYLLGFGLAVIVVGRLAHGGAPTLRRFVAAGLLGLVPVYALGATWLAVQLDLTPSAALTAGVLPFVAVDVVKALLAAGVARGLVSLPLGPLAPQRDR